MKKIQSGTNVQVNKTWTYCMNHAIYKPVISPQETLDTVLLISSSHREDAAARRETIRST